MCVRFNQNKKRLFRFVSIAIVFVGGLFNYNWISIYQENLFVPVSLQREINSKATGCCGKDNKRIVGRRILNEGDSDSDDYYQNDESVYEEINTENNSDDTQNSNSNSNNENNNHSNKHTRSYFDDDFNTKNSTIVVCIVLAFIILTISFEMFRGALEASISKDEIIILEKLFGELTVLGFLASTTFVVTKCGLLNVIAQTIRYDEEHLMEHVELVHFTIFSIMVFFVLQVIVLLRAATETYALWVELEKRCRDKYGRRRHSIIVNSSSIGNKQNNDNKSTNKREWALTTDDQRALTRLYTARWYTRFVPQLINKEDEFVRDIVTFESFRNEFVTDRSTEYPFHPKSDRDQLPRDFNFARYLSLSQARTLTQVVEVDVTAWIVFGIGTVLFYLLGLAVQNDIEMMTMSWIILGWAVFLFNIQFERHLIEVRNNFLPKNIVAMLKQSSFVINVNGDDWEHSQKVSALMTADPDSFPAWCDVDPDEYLTTRRPCLARRFVGGVPNRQQILFWMDRKGPQFYLFVLQLNLIFLGVYIGVLALILLPAIYAIAPVPLFILHLVVAILPAIGITYNKKRLVAVLTQVCSVGPYRKHQIISAVLWEKTISVLIRTLIINCVLRAAAKAERMRKSCQSGLSPCSVLSEGTIETPHTEFGETFGISNANCSGGTIRIDEIRSLLSRMGIDKLSDSSGTQRILSELEANIDCEVTMDEFLDWYLNLIHGSPIMPSGKDMFELFDKSQNGVVTVGEFKDTIDRMDIHLTIDEIGSIIREVDHNHIGLIDWETFERFLSKYSNAGR